MHMCAPSHIRRTPCAWESYCLPPKPPAQLGGTHPTLTCLPVPSPPPFTSQTIDFDESSGAVLRIQPLRTPRDENVYECVAQNSVGEITIHAKLTVLRGTHPRAQRKYPIADLAPKLRALLHWILLFPLGSRISLLPALPRPLGLYGLNVNAVCSLQAQLNRGAQSVLSGLCPWVFCDCLSSISLDHKCPP